MKSLNVWLVKYFFYPYILYIKTVLLHEKFLYRNIRWHVEIQVSETASAVEKCRKQNKSNICRQYIEFANISYNTIALQVNEIFMRTIGTLPIHFIQCLVVWLIWAVTIGCSNWSFIHLLHWQDKPHPFLSDLSTY